MTLTSGEPTEAEQRMACVVTDTRIVRIGRSVLRRRSLSPGRHKSMKTASCRCPGHGAPTSTVRAYRARQ